eukprot:5068131-Amphidinium_carterae.1
MQCAQEPWNTARLNMLMQGWQMLMLHAKIEQFICNVWLFYLYFYSSAGAESRVYLETQLANILCATNGFETYEYTQGSKAFEKDVVQNAY